MDAQNPTSDSLIAFTNIPPKELKDLIDKDGVVFRYEPMKDYLSQVQFLSASGLHFMIENTPVDFLYRFLSVPEEKDALLFGTAFHTYILEREDFGKHYDILYRHKLPEPEKDFRNAKNKDYRADFIVGCDMRGVSLITEEDFNTIKSMADGLSNDPTTNNILSQAGIRELSVYTKMEYNEKWFYVKLRPDLISKGKPFFMDLKKTKCASPAVTAFPKDSYIYGYDVKMAFYNDVLTQVWPQLMEFAGIKETGLRRSLIIACEDTPPYQHLVYNIPQEVIEAGRYRYRQSLSRFADCLATQEWKGYQIFSEPGNAGIIDLVLPSWTNREIIV